MVEAGGWGVEESLLEALARAPDSRSGMGSGFLWVLS
jgi:hypothetical protein